MTTETAAFQILASIFLATLYPREKDIRLMKAFMMKKHSHEQHHHKSQDKYLVDEIGDVLRRAMKV